MFEDNQPLLKMSNINKRFLGTVALKDVNIELNYNEILAIMGENGAGKSTLMKILSGFYPQSEYEGNIQISNIPFKIHSPHDSEKMGIAMIYQELNLELDLSIAENILLGSYPKTKLGLIDWKEVKSAAQSLLKQLNIDIDVNLTVRSLNASMQQLVSIVRALRRNPKILILDEPTSALTECETERLLKLLTNLKNEGISCIYISHKLDEVFQISDRMIILRDGEVVGEYKREGGFDSRKIIEDMIGRRLEVMYPKIEKTIGKELLRIENFKVPHAFAYGKNIIEDVSFTLNQGEILGIAGLVGSGRSELINSLFGLSKKTSGKVFLNQDEVKIKSPKDAIFHGMGLLSEDRKKNGYIRTMNVSDNMTLAILKSFKKWVFINRNEEKKIALEYFMKLKIKAPDLNTLITSLSGGNQQKVILSRWLMTSLKILLLDEPTRGIDVGTKAEIYKLILDLAKNGVSVVMISSELPELLAVCDRLVVLGKGKIQAEFNKEDANEVKIIQAASCI